MNLSALTDADKTALLESNCGISFDSTGGALWLSTLAPNGRMVNIIVSASRAEVILCRGPFGEGFTLCKCYGKPEASIPEAIERLGRYAA